MTKQELDKLRDKLADQYGSPHTYQVEIFKAGWDACAKELGDQVCTTQMNESEEKIMDAGFDHPCKQTCSGWQQGYDRGYRVFQLSLEKNLAEMKIERDQWCRQARDLSLVLKSIYAENKTAEEIDRILGLAIQSFDNFEEGLIKG